MVEDGSEPAVSTGIVGPVNLFRSSYFSLILEAWYEQPYSNEFLSGVPAD